MKSPESIDYAELARIRNSIIRDGVSPFDVYYSKRKKTDAIVFIPIDTKTEGLLRQFDFKREINGYASTQELYNKKKQIIDEEGLKEFELIILICLRLGVWGEKSKDENARDVISDEEDYKNTLIQVDSLRELLDLVAHFESFLSGHIPYPVGSLHSTDTYPEYTLHGATFLFQKGRNETISGSKKITFRSRHAGGIIQHMLGDYLNMLHERGTTFEKRLMIDENYLNRKPTPAIQNEHYLFHYRFVSFLENVLAPSKPSRASILSKYAKLMSETGYVVRNAKSSEKSSSIKNWYKKGREMQAKLQNS